MDRSFVAPPCRRGDAGLILSGFFDGIIFLNLSIYDVRRFNTFRIDFDRSFVAAPFRRSDLISILKGLKSGGDFPFPEDALVGLG